MQLGNPRGGDQPRLELLAIERLGEVIVDAGSHSVDHVMATFERREDDEVRVRCAWRSARTRRHSSSPSMPGIIQSLMTTSASEP